VITLRPATLGDLQAIHDIRRDAILAVTFAALSEKEIREWAGRRSVEYFGERVAANQAVIAISETDPVGWGSFSGDRVTALYVRPSASSKGIGRKLMSWLEARIRDEGHASAKLESSPNAVAFYRGLGYLEVGAPDQHGAVPMFRELAKAV
jgi:GNAT superfamily N-acetyltransferase